MSTQSSQAWLATWFGFCTLVVIFVTSRNSSNTTFYQTPSSSSSSSSSSNNNNHFAVKSSTPTQSPLSTTITSSPLPTIIPCAAENIVTANLAITLSDFNKRVKDILRRCPLSEQPIEWLVWRWSTLPHKVKNGTLMEFGVYGGGSLDLIWKGVQASNWTGSVHGFDSFEGLPEKWRDNFEPGQFGSKDLYEQVRSYFPAQLLLHRGWFQETLPRVLAASPSLPPLALLHLDADLFSSTVEVFTMLNRHIVPGTYLLFDELINYPGYIQHEMRAFWLWLQYSGASVCTIGVQSLVLDTEEERGSQSALFQVITAPMGMKQ